MRKGERSATLRAALQALSSHVHLLTQSNRPLNEALWGYLTQCEKYFIHEVSPCYIPTMWHFSGNHAFKSIDSQFVHSSQSFTRGMVLKVPLKDLLPASITSLFSCRSSFVDKVQVGCLPFPSPRDVSVAVTPLPPSLVCTFLLKMILYWNGMMTPIQWIFHFSLNERKMPCRRSLYDQNCSCFWFIFVANVSEHRLRQELGDCFS